MTGLRAVRRKGEREVEERRRIPLIDIGAVGPVALARAAPERFSDILAQARARYTEAGLRVGDLLSRRWLERRANPYGAEIAAIAAENFGPGAFLLNLSYEWTCTTGVGPDPAGQGSRLRRTLDWQLDGLGRNAVVAAIEAPAGSYFNITWPGFVGVATAMAPGRFSAALNQPPAPRWCGVLPVDWAIARSRFWRSRALPPVHLLRKVFDEARTYDEAKRLLCETPVSVPAFFTLSGTAAAQGCIVERLESRFACRLAPASIANHWVSFPVAGWERGADTVRRFELMEEMRDLPGDDFDWVRPPILNETTRLAVTANAAEGRLVVRGYEADGPATEVFTL